MDAGEPDEYRERFAQARKQTLNTWGWTGLVDDLRAEARSRAAKNRLSNILSNARRGVPWFKTENVLKEFLDNEWESLKRKREKIKTLVEECGLFSISDKNSDPPEISKRVKAALLTEVFGSTEVYQENGGTCPAHELLDCTFASWVMGSVGLVGERLVGPEKVQVHVDLLMDILEDGGIDMTPDLSYPCSRVVFVTGREPKTVVLSEEIVELKQKKIQVRETIEMEKDETIQLPEKIAERMMRQGAAAKFVYRCESCGGSVPRNEPDEEPPTCPECGSSKIYSVHPKTAKEVARVLEKYYRRGTQVETFLEELTAAFATGLAEGSYPEIDAEQARKLASKIVPGRERSFLNKVADQFMWMEGGSKGKSNGRASGKKSFRHEGNAPIERIAREGE